MKMKRIVKRVLSVSLISVTLCLASCGNNGNAPSQTDNMASPSVPSAPTPEVPNPDTTLNKIKFKLDGETEAFSFKFKPDGAKLVDARDAEMARLTVDETQKIKIKNPADEAIGYVVSEKGYWKIKNADQTQELYVLRRQTDGDYKLETGSDRQIYRIKKRDYGYEIETPDKQSLYKVKLKNGKLSLRNANEETVLYTKDDFLPIALASFGFDELTREQQAALAYAVYLSGG
jgi:hypothetical protein